MYQQITIVGNLGKDPEMRYTADGTPVTNFSVAVSNASVSSGVKALRCRRISFFAFWLLRCISGFSPIRLSATIQLKKVFAAVR